MLTGVILTLVAVLFIHLMFTAQYHWPLAPVNYVLQLSGVTTLLISLIATIHVVLSATFAESEKWPYMLSYIAVNVPPLDLESNTEGWSVAERATWLVMNASTSGLIQITHIQFLTLLYPSRLEGRLIFALLGPLAVVAAVMQLLPITWRTDGGTAVFGCASLSLAVVSTALNFLYVHKEEEFVWLPGLMWAVVLWQSFLGWWWWVGAGSSDGYSIEDEKMEERLRREAKRQARKKEARERRKETRVKAQKVWKGVAGAFAPNSGMSTSAQSREMSSGQAEVRSRSSTAGVAPSSPKLFSSASQDDPDMDIDDDPSRRHRRRRNQNSEPSAADSSHASSVTVTGSSSVSTSGSRITLSTLPRLLPGVIGRWYASLRHAHNAAARVQAAERVERIREMGRARNDPGTARVEGWGWSWEGLGWRGRSRSRLSPKRTNSNLEEVVEEEKHTNRSGQRSRKTIHEDSEGYEMHNCRDRSVDEEPTDISEEDDQRGRSRRQQSRRDHDPERRTQNSTPDELPPPAAAARSRSLWWWGPLRRWRLQDATIY
ncbi:hypothetical protein M413DRAFT_446537 [Hebeloma cylindrosporum]|uniref:Uncharacterized protein n=1 Tax=Hebeloma cylindrosporum TaxID=76867 RepID=A0A0C2YGY6_HEBCY|nr:hypothetical protein M413DRAFT_446537 [Hebeloma cylindrosporum h7]